MKLKFEQFKTEITNPTVTVDKVVNDLNPDTMTLTANVVLETDSVKFGVQLKDVAINDLNYNYSDLCARVDERLKEYEI